MYLGRAAISALALALTVGAALSASAQGYTPCIERPMFLRPYFDKPKLAKPMFDHPDLAKADFEKTKATRPQFMPSEFVKPIFERPTFENCNLRTVYQSPSYAMLQRLQSPVTAGTNTTAQASRSLRQLAGVAPKSDLRLAFKDPFLQALPSQKVNPNAYSMAPQARPTEDCCGGGPAPEANGPVMVPAAPTTKLR